MARDSSYTYDPNTGKWKQSSSDSKSDKGTKAQDKTVSTKVANGTSNLSATSSDKLSSKGSVEKKYNEIEVNTLSGTLTFICTKQTIKLKAGDTVTLKGLGKYLSGKYYVKDVTRSIGTDGYSHSATVIRTDFGSSLKTSSKVSDTQAPVTPAPTPAPAPKVEKPAVPVQSSPAPVQNPVRTYTVKKGDTLWAISKKYYGNGNSWGKIYDANTRKIANPNLIYPGQVFVIP